MQLGPWSLKEDQLLISLVESNGPSRWNYISSFLPGRIGKQCRERWCNHLSPYINKSSWSEEEFPLLKLAYIALEKKGSYPIAFNAANEVAVGLFIDHKIKFTQIAGITEKVMKYDFSKECNSFDEIVEVDSKARAIALEGF